MQTDKKPAPAPTPKNLPLQQQLQQSGIKLADIQKVKASDGRVLVTTSTGKLWFYV